MRLLGIVVCTMCLSTIDVEARRGYSMSFQGPYPVLSLASGAFDFANVPELKTLGDSSNFTICGWFKIARGKLDQPLLSTNGAGEGTIYGMLWVDWKGGNPVGGWRAYYNDIPARTFHQREEWHHLAFVNEDGVFRTYINGTLIQERPYVHWGAMPNGVPTFRSGRDDRTLHLGARLFSQPYVSGPTMATGIKTFPIDGVGFFNGKMDDFAIYSSALSTERIQEAMNVSYTSSDVPSDLPIYYNFDVLGCGSGVTSLSDVSCGITGDNIVKNIGTAGSSGDLLVGQLNDDYGFGKYWLHLMESKSEPTKFPYTKPTIGIDTPPLYDTSDNLVVPTVLQVNFGENMTFNLPTSSTPDKIASLPVVGALLRGSNGAALSLNEDISGETTLTYVADASPSVFTDAFLFRVSYAGTLLHEVHVWPYKAPILTTVRSLDYLDGKISLKTIEGGVMVQELKTLVTSPTGEYLDLQILQAPDPSHFPGFLQMARQFGLQDPPKVLPWESITHVPQPIVDNKIPNEGGMVIFVQPAPTFYGLGKVVAQFVSPVTGFTSRPLTVALKVIMIDELAKAYPVNTTIVREDNETGVYIKLNASDQEMRFGLGYTISKLPKKGKLYKKENGNWVEIKKAFNTYEISDVFDQYASKVVKVSSFDAPMRRIGRKGNTGLYVGHPMLILGRPDEFQGGEALDLFADPNFDSYPGLIVEVNICGPSSIYANASNEVWMAAKVVNVKNGTGMDEIIEVEVLPMHKYEGGQKKKCIIWNNNDPTADMNFPRDCNENLAVEGPFIIGNLSRTSPHINAATPRGWRNNFYLYQGDKVLSLTDEANDGKPNPSMSMAFGEEYFFNHTQSEFYESGIDPPYTEYIELEFEQPVFLAQYVVHFAADGGGSIVRVRAENPDGAWTMVYENPPQKAKSILHQESKQPFIFNEMLCRPNFKSKKFRMEMDTTQETGIAGLMTIDYVKVAGSSTIQTGILAYGEDQIMYVPDPDKYGRDTFEYQAVDCVGDATRQTKAVEVNIDIQAVDDNPVIELPANDIYVFCNSSTGVGKADFSISAFDVDLEQVSIAITTQPAHGTVRELGSKLRQGSSDLQYTDTVLEYYTTRCNDVEYDGGFDLFNVTAIDPKGHQVTIPVKVEVLKEDKKIAVLSKFIAIVFFAVNGLFSLLCFLWVLKNKANAIVKASQKEFLMIMAAGTFISSSTILTFIVDDGYDGKNQGAADFACALMPWLYTFGFMTTFIPLYAKLFKVYSMFEVNFALKLSNAAAKEKQRLLKSISVRGLLWKLSLFWVIDLLIVAIWTGSAPLQFQRMPVRSVTIDEVDFVVESVGYCTSGGSTDSVFIGLIAAYHIIVLSIVGYYCYKTTHINDTFSEAKYLRVSIASSLQILLFSIPIMLITSDTPDAETTVFIRSGVIWLNDISVLAFVFFPKMWAKVHGISESGAGAEQLQHSVQTQKSKQSSVAPMSSTTQSSTVLSSKKGHF